MMHTSVAMSNVVTSSLRSPSWVVAVRATYRSTHDNLVTRPTGAPGSLFPHHQVERHLHASGHLDFPGRIGAGLGRGV